MTYNVDESSTSDSRPIELFDFVFSTITYRYTSYHRDFTYLGNVYTANGVQRGAITVVNAQDIPEPRVEVPVTDPVAALYLGHGVPPQRFRITITRYQQTSGQVEQQVTGDAVCNVRSSTDRGFVASFKVMPVQSDPMQFALPSVILARLCNHVLYDSLCTIVRATKQVATTITSIDSTRRIIGVASVGGFTNFQWGEFLHTTTQERRGIVLQAGTTLTLDVRLRSEVIVGDAISIFQGCNRLVATCRDSFNNVPNFGGHPHNISSNFSFVDVRKL